MPLSDTPESLAPAAVEARDRAAILPTYARTAFHPRSGKGAKLVDAAGKEYWDLLGGIAVNALGYRHPRLVRAMKEEATGVWHVSNLFYIPAQGLLAERLLAASGMSRVFFCNTGTEATEAALTFARLKNPGRSKVVALEEGFHGRTFGALSITGHEPYRTPFEPLVPSAAFVPPNDAAALEAAVTPDTSAVVLEPILGEGGIIPLTPGYVAAARRAADRVGALLVFDEVQSGLGRTGHLFVFRELGVVPDVVTLAKPLGGGLPLGAVLCGPALDGLLRPGMHGTTFGGNPVACRLGLEVLDEIETGGLLARVADLGAWFGKAARRLKKKQPAIADVRGRGLIWGIELDREASPVQKKLLERGFVVGTARSKVLRLLPPYVVPKAALRAFLGTLDDILKETNA
ncbi:MAG TPA: acetylornithine transaminase [Thermoanaerobaculia bacterium]|nr:acetylornithine transaminase [Thermoanaerobaculia bacterium]